jgi:hypothetical protein
MPDLEALSRRICAATSSEAHDVASALILAAILMLIEDFGDSDASERVREAIRARVAHFDAKVRVN